MIKWSEYRFYRNLVQKYQIGTDNKLSKSSKAVARVTDEKKGKKQLSTKKKIALGILIAAALAAVIFVVLIFVLDLGPVTAIESSEEDARIVGECAGFDVRYEELRYVTHMHRASLDKEYGRYADLDEDGRASYEAELCERVSKDLRNNYAVLSLCSQYGVDIDSKEARNYVNDAINDLVDEIGGKKMYKDWLSQNNLTDSFLRLMYKVAYLETVLVEELTATGEEIEYSTANLDDFVAYIMEDESYVKVIHAYYPNEFDYTKDKKEGNNARETADNVLSAILAAGNDEDRFDLMMSSIGAAPFVAGYSTTGSDYYVTYGQMHADYESIAFSLSEYEVGSVLELDEGCYIIMRVPKVRDEVAPRAYELIDQYRYAVLKRMTDKQRESICFVGNSLFESLTLAEID